MCRSGKNMVARARVSVVCRSRQSENECGIEGATTSTVDVSASRFLFSFFFRFVCMCFSLSLAHSFTKFQLDRIDLLQCCLLL